jgi:hypothetical protein
MKATVPGWQVHPVTTLDMYLETPPSWHELQPQGQQVLSFTVSNGGGPADVSHAAVFRDEVGDGATAQGEQARSLQSRLPNAFEIVHSDTVQIDGLPAARAVIDLVPSMPRGRQEWVTVVHGHYAYTLRFTFAGKNESFADVQPTVEKVAGTMKFE